MAEDTYEEDFLFRLVVCTSAHETLLGVIEDVRIAAAPNGELRKVLTIRNLLRRGTGNQVRHVRDAPRVGGKVYFATADDLRKFFPKKESHGYLGYVRGTNFLLPLDFDRLCFGNTAILAGINHGKSHLAALAVSQLHVMRKKILVIDPSGEWTTLANKFKKMMEDSANRRISVRSHVVEQMKPVMTSDTLPWEGGDKIIETFYGGDLTIVDVSLTKGQLKAEEKVDLRCRIVCDLHQALMRHASWQYGTTKFLYGMQGCIVLDEAHEFVPFKHTFNIQRQLTTLFSISTKSYRKYGLGHIFIDQSLKAISQDLQIQTYLLGATTTPTDINFVESQLGEEVASAAQRTIGGVERPSWVAYGVATPMNGIPWEIDALGTSDVSALSERSS